jgi:hypothetical protein
MPAALRIPATPKPAATPATGKEIETERPDGGEKADAPAIPDWGLSRKKPHRQMKFKIAAVALALIGTAGGYVAYDHFLGNVPAADGVAQNRGAMASSDDSNGLDPTADSLGPSDPFDDVEPTVRPAANSRTSAAKEPRRMGTSPDATPIGRRTAATDRTRFSTPSSKQWPSASNKRFTLATETAPGKAIAPTWVHTLLSPSSALIAPI